jgi:phage head maturation protease
MQLTFQMSAKTTLLTVYTRLVKSGKVSGASVGSRCARNANPNLFAKSDEKRQARRLAKFIGKKLSGMPERLK